MLLSRWAGRHFAARSAVYLFALLPLIGYGLTLSAVTGYLGISGRLSLFLGAAALAYLIVATVMVALDLVLNLVRRQLPRDLDPGRRRVLNTVGNVLLAAPAVAIGYGMFVERTNFRVREVDIPLDGLPQDLDGLRILQISDIHIGAFLSERELARAIDAASETRPHVAVVTGDLLTSPGDPLDACVRQLARIKTDAGTFGCLGNHERFARAENRTAAVAARAGIRFLRFESQALRFGKSILNLAGVDYQSQHGKEGYLRGAERLVMPGAVNILLSHNPDVFPVAARQGYNLLLAGHTHGGQITVEILDRTLNPARFLTPYVYGLYGTGASAAYVTRGIGTIGIPARIGAPPEISLLRLRKA
jgi:predicted MPP superfamily phosphohydrolase